MIVGVEKAGRRNLIIGIMTRSIGVELTMCLAVAGLTLVVLKLILLMFKLLDHELLIC